jgi:hypothetical protein
VVTLRALRVLGDLRGQKTFNRKSSLSFRKGRKVTLLDLTASGMERQTATIMSRTPLLSGRGFT